MNDIGLMTTNDDHVKLKKAIFQSCKCANININAGQGRITIFGPRPQNLNPLHRKQKF